MRPTPLNIFKEAGLSYELAGLFDDRVRVCPKRTEISMSPSDGKMADPILVATIVRQVFEDGMRRQRLHLTGEIVAWLELEITSVWEVWEEEDRKNTILEAYLEMLRDELTTAHQLLDDIEDGDNAKLALELARKNCKLECRMTLDLITDGTGP